MGMCWYLAYPLSTCHVEELMEEGGVNVDHSTVNRWVVKYSPGSVSQEDFGLEVCDDMAFFTRRRSWCSFPYGVLSVTAIKSSKAA